MDRIVWPLKQSVFAVADKLETLKPILQGGTQLPTRYDDARGDVVLKLDLSRSGEVLPKLVHPPSTGAVQTHPQVHADELAIVVLELMARFAIDHVDPKMRSPISLPLFLVKPLDNERHRVDVRRNLGQPIVVLLGVIARWSQQLDDTPERTAGVEHTSAFVLLIIGLFGGTFSPTIGIVSSEYFIELGKVRVDLGNEDRSALHVVAQRLADLAFASPANRTRLVAHGAVPSRPNQTP